MAPRRGEMLARGGRQFILNTLAVIFVGLAVVLGLSLLLFPPTSALFLGTAIAAGVCAAISLTCVGLARREKAKAIQGCKPRSRKTHRGSSAAAGGGAAPTSSLERASSFADTDTDSDGKRLSSAAAENVGGFPKFSPGGGGDRSHNK